MIKHYLIAYNVISCVAWAAVALLAARDGLASFATLQLVQSMALLEIAHALLGLVRSPVLTTAMQIASRLLVVYATRPFLPVYWTLLAAWCTTEVVRYAFYATSLVQKTPSWLIWTRYSLFLVLYPMGVASELILVWHSDMLASLRWVICAIYAPGFWILFSHMLKQRRKLLIGVPDAPKKKQK